MSKSLYLQRISTFAAVAAFLSGCSDSGGGGSSTTSGNVFACNAKVNISGSTYRAPVYCYDWKDGTGEVNWTRTEITSPTLGSGPAIALRGMCVCSQRRRGGKSMCSA